MKRNHWIGLSVAVIAIGAIVWALSQRSPTHSPITALPDATAAAESERPQPELAGSASPTPTTREDVSTVAAVEAASAASASVTTVRGRVVDDKKAPITRFEIRTRLVDEPEEAHIALLGYTNLSVDDEQGAFELGLPNGVWSIEAVSPAGTKSNPVTVKVPGKQSPLVLTMIRRASVAGVVLASDGLPVANAEIHGKYAGDPEPVLHTENADVDAKRGARTDAAGRFRIDGLRPGTLELMAIHARYCESAWKELTLIPEELSEITLHVTPGGTIVGHVDPSRGTVSDRSIALFSLNGLFGWRRTKSDANGKFTIEHVVPQKYVIELRSEGVPEGAIDPAGTGVRKSLVVREGETTEVILGANEGRLHLTGRVLCAGRPVEGIRVTAGAEGSEDRHEDPTTKADGHFEMDVSGPGQYAFWLYADNSSYVTFDRTITPETREIEFEIPGGAVPGVVVSSKGKPLARVPITILRKAEAESEDSKKSWKRYRRTLTDDEGAFEFKLLEPGTYTLRAPDGFWGDRPPRRIPHGGVVLPDLQVGATPITALRVQLVEEAHASVQVVDASGTPVGNAWIQAKDASNMYRFGRWELQTDADGYCVVHSLAPGVYTWVAYKGDKNVSSPPSTVEAGKTARVKIQLP